jgi:hypothetical protein
MVAEVSIIAPSGSVDPVVKFLSLSYSILIEALSASICLLMRWDSIISISFSHFWMTYSILHFLSNIDSPSPDVYPLIFYSYSEINLTFSFLQNPLNASFSTILYSLWRFLISREKLVTLSLVASNWLSASARFFLISVWFEVFSLIVSSICFLFWFSVSISILHLSKSLLSFVYSSKLYLEFDFESSSFSVSFLISWLSFLMSLSSSDDPKLRLNTF